MTDVTDETVTFSIELSIGTLGIVRHVRHTMREVRP